MRRIHSFRAGNLKRIRLYMCHQNASDIQGGISGTRNVLIDFNAIER